MNYDNIINKLEQLPWKFDDNDYLNCYLPNSQLVFTIRRSSSSHNYIFVVYYFKDGEKKDHRIRNKKILDWAQEKFNKECDKLEEELLNTIINKFPIKSLGPYR